MHFFLKKGCLGLSFNNTIHVGCFSEQYISFDNLLTMTMANMVESYTYISSCWFFVSRHILPSKRDVWVYCTTTQFLFIGPVKSHHYSGSNQLVWEVDFVFQSCWWLLDNISYPPRGSLGFYFDYLRIQREESDNLTLPLRFDHLTIMMRDSDHLIGCMMSVNIWGSRWKQSDVLSFWSWQPVVFAMQIILIMPWLLHLRFESDQQKFALILRCESSTLIL